jgi:hypothetical protein
MWAYEPMSERATNSGAKRPAPPNVYIRQNILKGLLTGVLAQSETAF